MNEPVAWFEQDPDMKSIWYQSDQDNPNAIPLYTTPQKYCPSENNAAYEKGFIDGMAKQRDSKVQQFVEAYANSMVEGTKLEAIRKTFGESSPKKEGESVSFDLADMNVTFPVRPEFQNPETTYVERRVPIELEDEAHELIDNWLKSKGYGEDI